MRKRAAIKASFAAYLLSTSLTSYNPPFPVACTPSAPFLFSSQSESELGPVKDHMDDDMSPSFVRGFARYFCLMIRGRVGLAGGGDGELFFGVRERGS